MSLRRELRALYHELREVNDNLTTDDAPVWAEVLGTVLAVGLVVRGGIHVWTALLGSELPGVDIDPTVDKQDITLASPVFALRGHRLDLFARLITAAIGIALWQSMVSGARPPLVNAFTAAQLAVCIADPLVFVVWGAITYRDDSKMRETTHREQKQSYATERGGS